MNSFLSHIIQRHTLPAENIQPRLPGRFEGMPSNGFEPIEETPLATPAETPVAVNSVPVIEVPIDKIPSASPLTESNPLPSPASTSHTIITGEQTIFPGSKQAGDLPKRTFSYPDVALTSLTRTPSELPEPDGRLPINEINPPVSHIHTEPPTLRIFNNTNTVNTEHIFTTEKQLFNKAINHSILNDPIKKEFIENHFLTGLQTPAASSVIKVSIGRIDIRATPSGTTAKESQNGSSYKPQLSLEAYLKNRNSR